MAPLTDKTADSWRELRTVTPIRRLFAHLIDQCLWVGAAYWQFTSFSRIDSTGPGSPAVYGQVLASAFAMVFLLAVYVILATKGRTVGKWLMGIIIIKNDGTSAGFGTVIARDVFGKFVSAIFLYLGFLWILLDSRNQGWHDKLMGTTVVYAKEHQTYEKNMKSIP